MTVSHKFFARAVGVSLAISLALLAAPVAALAQTGSAARLTQPSFDLLVPHGTTVSPNHVLVWDTGGREYAVGATNWSRTQPTPWMIVAERTVHGSWNPLLLAQTQHAFGCAQIVADPQPGGKTAVDVSFVVDAATGLTSHVYSLLVGPGSARIVGQIPQVVGMFPIRRDGQAFHINGLNLQAVQRQIHGRWTTDYTPLRQLLENTSHPIGFVMGWSLVNGKTVKKISLIGPSVIHAKVGQSLSFAPLNSQAASHMLGSAYEQKSFTGISVFTAAPHQPLMFDQAAQLFQNTVHLSTPGMFVYAITPPGYTQMTPNEQVAIVKVEVTL